MVILVYKKSGSFGDAAAAERHSISSASSARPPFDADQVESSPSSSVPKEDIFRLTGERFTSSSDVASKVHVYETAPASSSESTKGIEGHFDDPDDSYDKEGDNMSSSAKRSLLKDAGVRAAQQLQCRDTMLSLRDAFESAIDMQTRMEMLRQKDRDRLAALETRHREDQQKLKELMELLAGGISPADLLAAQEKIKELQAKLLEYEQREEDLKVEQWRERLMNSKSSFNLVMTLSRDAHPLEEEDADEESEGEADESEEERIGSPLSPIHEHPSGETGGVGTNLGLANGCDSQAGATASATMREESSNLGAKNRKRHEDRAHTYDPSGGAPEFQPTLHGGASGSRSSPAAAAGRNPETLSGSLRQDDWKFYKSPEDPQSKRKNLQQTAQRGTEQRETGDNAGDASPSNRNDQDKSGENAFTETANGRKNIGVPDGGHTSSGTSGRQGSSGAEANDVSNSASSASATQNRRKSSTKTSTGKRKNEKAEKGQPKMLAGGRQCLSTVGNGNNTGENLLLSWVVKLWAHKIKSKEFVRSRDKGLQTDDGGPLVEQQCQTEGPSASELQSLRDEVMDLKHDLKQSEKLRLHAEKERDALKEQLTQVLNEKRRMIEEMENQMAQMKKDFDLQLNEKDKEGLRLQQQLLAQQDAMRRAEAAWENERRSLQARLRDVTSDFQQALTNLRRMELMVQKLKGKEGSQALKDRIAQLIEDLEFAKSKCAKAYKQRDEAVENADSLYSKLSQTKRKMELERQFLPLLHAAKGPIGMQNNKLEKMEKQTSNSKSAPQLPSIASPTRPEMLH